MNLGKIAENIKLAITDEITAVQKKSHAKKVTLSHGTKVDSKPGEFIYSFPLKESLDFEEDCPIQVDCGGRTANGSIVYIKEDEVTVSLSEDFGERIHKINLTSQQSYLLENLKEKLGEKFASEKLDETIFRKTLERKGSAASPSAFDCKSLLNQEQKFAVGFALSNPVTFIWGPPGTGKTHTLAELIYQAQARKMSILVVSNTNRSLDALILKLGQLIKGEDFFHEGQTIRIGNIVHEELATNFSDYITPQKIADRLNESLISEKNRCSTRVSEYIAKLSQLEPILDLFNKYKQLKNDKVDLENQINISLEKKNLVQSIREDVVEKIEKFGKDLNSPGPGLKLKNLMGIRTYKSIESDIEKESRNLIDLDQNIAVYTKNIESLSESLAQKAAEYKSTKHALLKLVPSGHATAAVEEIANIRQEIVAERIKIREIDNQLNDTIKKVYANAKIVAATATKVHLDKYLNRKFDMVVIDEASMLNLPLSLYCCLHANNRIVIAGDFRQIPPIYFDQKSEIVKDFYAKNIFSFSGIETLVNQGKTAKQLIQLRFQYRMQWEICELINRPVYGGNLITETKPLPINVRTSQILSKPVTIVDTSADNPFSNYKPRTNSRYNLINACTIISILENISKDVDLAEVGVITAFKAQADLINKLLENTAYSKVACGTIHKFQGSEKKVVILDITDSIGTPKSKYIKARSLDDEGVKLYNVALSRAKDNLIVVGNLYFLFDKVGNGFVSNVLADATAYAPVISGHTLFNFGSYKKAIREAYPHKTSLPNPNEMVLVNEKDFSNVFPTDLLEAKQFVTIFSPFCTSKRVGILGDYLRTLVQRNVKVRVVTRPPHEHVSIQQTQVSEAINSLVNMGVVVDLRSQMHEKICIIDGTTLWHGSLNILSYNERTNETMMRLTGDSICRAMAELLHFKLRNKAALSISELVAEKENDDCDNCQSSTILVMKGRNGLPYFKCISCDKTQSLDKPRTFASNYKVHSTNLFTNDLNITEKPCPLCKSPMKLREGKYGLFWGCITYPNCKGKESWKPN